MDGESVEVFQRNTTSRIVDAGESEDVGHSWEELMLLS